MRNIISLSLPKAATKELKGLSKKRGFDSVSGYIQYLLAQDKDLIGEEQLLRTVRQARRDYKTGKTIKAASMAELI